MPRTALHPKMTCRRHLLGHTISTATRRLSHRHGMSPARLRCASQPSEPASRGTATHARARKPAQAISETTMNTTQLSRDSQCTAIFRGKTVGYKYLVRPVTTVTVHNRHQEETMTTATEETVRPRAIGYLRVSTNRQAKHGYGLAAQCDQVEQFCTQHGLDLVGLHVGVMSARKPTSCTRASQL